MDKKTIDYIRKLVKGDEGLAAQIIELRELRELSDIAEIAKNAKPPYIPDQTNYYPVPDTTPVEYRQPEWYRRVDSEN